MKPILRSEFTRAVADLADGEFLRSVNTAVTNSQHFNHGHLERWQLAVDGLSKFAARSADLAQPAPRLGVDRPEHYADAEALLREFMPWRKGPFELAGLSVDCEWRSDLKWERLQAHLDPLDDAVILDVGAGNGYFSLRLAALGAKAVLGIDPLALYVMQFRALAALGLPHPVDVVPLIMSDLDAVPPVFDCCLSMGVLYHRRSPIEHLRELKAKLKPGGQLVLETLIVDGDETTILVPPKRYARMRNVWFLPSVPALAVWLEKCGFTDIRVADISVTTAQEQRASDWMPFESLPESLNPDNPGLTVEGLPAPTRALLTARCP